MDMHWHCKIVSFSGSEAEADEIIQSHGDSKSLAIWCAMLKRELTEKKRETKTLREEHEKMRREHTQKQKLIDERNKQLTIARERLVDSSVSRHSAIVQINKTCMNE